MKVAKFKMKRIDGGMTIDIPKAADARLRTMAIEAVFFSIVCIFWYACLVALFSLERVQ